MYHRGRLQNQFACSSGINQGDIMGTFAYCPLAQDIYSKSIEGTGAKLYAVVDDSTVISKDVNTLKTVLENFVRIGKPHGLLVNKNKTKLYTNGGADLSDVDVKSCNEITILGVPFSSQKKYTQKVIAGSITEFESMLTKLRDLPLQIALILMRLSALPSLNYLMRTVGYSNPHAFRKFKQADAKMRETLHNIVIDKGRHSSTVPPQSVKTQLYNRLYSQMALPLRSGGLALPQLLHNSFGATFSSILASDISTEQGTTARQKLLHANQALNEFTGSDMTLENRIAKIRELQKGTSRNGQAITRKITTIIRQQFVNPVLEREAFSTEQNPHATLQKFFATISSRKSCLTARNSSLLLSRIPTTNAMTLNDDSYLSFLHDRLGLSSIVSLEYDTCRHCQLIKEHNHVYHCVQTTNSRYMIRRHGFVQRTLKRHLDKAYITAMEPMLREQVSSQGSEEAKQHQRRADVLCFPPAPNDPGFNIDVAIVWPHQSQFKEQKEDSLPHLVEREKRKNSQYMHIPEQSFRCYPFIMDTYGNLGKQALERLNHLVARRRRDPAEMHRGATLLPTIIAELQATLHRAQCQMKVKAFGYATLANRRRIAERFVSSILDAGSSSVLVERKNTTAEQRPEAEQKVLAAVTTEEKTEETTSTQQLTPTIADVSSSQPIQTISTERNSPLATRTRSRTKSSRANNQPKPSSK